METTRKEQYEAPMAEVMELKYEGIICQSEVAATMDGVFVEETI